MLIRPENVQLGGTIHKTKAEKYRNIWIKGEFNLYVPLWRYDISNLGVIEVPERVIELSELLSRIQDFYEQPVSVEFIREIIRRDPTVEGYLDEYIIALRQGRTVTVGNLLGGLMFLEEFTPQARGDYSLGLSS
nr:hypothetical protein Cbor_368 [Cedratvirus borely]